MGFQTDQVLQLSKPFTNGGPLRALTSPTAFPVLRTSSATCCKNKGIAFLHIANPLTDSPIRATPSHSAYLHSGSPILIPYTAALNKELFVKLVSHAKVPTRTDPYCKLKPKPIPSLNHFPQPYPRQAQQFRRKRAPVHHSPCISPLQVLDPDSDEECIKQKSSQRR